MKLLVFTRNGEKLPAFPERDGLEYKHVQFESNNLDDLLLIAKYRIINFPTSLIIDGRGRILLKVKGSIPKSYVDSVMR